MKRATQADLSSKTLIFGKLDKVKSFLEKQESLSVKESRF